MKVVLDHIGIAVRDLDKALEFYRDALGLEIGESEDVPSEHVRARFIPVGDASLELLEATSEQSAIARSIERRGPGLHHVTLRVDDIAAASEENMQQRETPARSRTKRKHPGGRSRRGPKKQR